MQNLKHIYKTSYRINGPMKDFINRLFEQVCKKVKCRCSKAKIARAFWECLRDNPKFSREFINLVCRKLKNK